MIPILCDPSQFGILLESPHVQSLSPFPFKILSKLFSIRETLVSACFGAEKCNNYPFCRPGVKASNSSLTVSFSFKTV